MIVPISGPEKVEPFRMEREVFEDLKLGKIDIAPYDGSVADLLLSSPSTAIMHYHDDENRYILNGVMLAVNYHRGHSEGDHLIVLQNPRRPEDGQLALDWHSDSEKIIRTRRMMNFALLKAFPDSESKPYPFEKSPTNPLKIRNYYIHIGDTAEALQSFIDQGYQLEN